MEFQEHEIVQMIWQFATFQKLKKEDKMERESWNGSFKAASKI